MKVLVVDDDEVSLAMAEKILQRDGYEVLLADSGKAALELLHQADVQIVLTDWNMPEMDGLQLCQRIRAISGVGYIYVILVTMRNSRQDMLIGLTDGADDFISKPFEPAELLVRVHNAERVLALETTALTLFSLAKLAESKDTDTGKHLERMREYARAIAEHLVSDSMPEFNLPSRFPDLMYQTSPLHDIGKVGVPDYVLLKPGSLNDEEWAIMKKHAEIGAATLDAALSKYPNAEFLRIARDIAWAHHERWDGKGYPLGLSGEAIPLCARIVAIADAYDAITMQRVYKIAQPHAVARGILIQESGKQFDPRLVQAFLDIEEQFITIKDGFVD